MKKCVYCGEIVNEDAFICSKGHSRFSSQRGTFICQEDLSKTLRELLDGYVNLSQKDIDILVNEYPNLKSGFYQLIE